LADNGTTQNIPLLILRTIFVIVAIGVGVFLFTSAPDESPLWPILSLTGTISVALIVIAVDAFFKRKQIEVISAVYFGIIVGLFLTYIVHLALQPLFIETPGTDTAPYERAAILVVGMILCYLCVSLLLQTRNDFRFIIPYIEFSKEVKGSKPYILDTSVVIDGRIADVVKTKIIDNKLIMPRFVLSELHAIADSSDRLRRGRGRRGLNILNDLQANGEIELSIFDRELPEFAGQQVDQKLVILAKHLDGKIITNDFNLNKVARLNGVGVINLNDVANALKPLFLPGEIIEVRVVKPGEESGQGVGYLDDGTMVVVEGGREHINESVKIVVTQMLQTSAGRMIFGRIEAPGRN
jgi:uncharacterized protein YacL